MALNIFLEGLDNSIKNIVKARNNQSLAEALQNAIEEERMTLFKPNTLALGRDTLMRWVKKDVNSNDLASSVSQEEIASTTPTVKTKIQKVEEWLSLLPKVPSHYL